ncbi:hypothetical protein ACFYQT_38035 [Streptomyces tibetensis]|uniref:Uncharacterized protein n=1 Tax=Streptomyces tibetensis TaxID=2382123 RepID=A0ABW6N7D9_9ACTN
MISYKNNKVHAYWDCTNSSGNPWVCIGRRHVDDDAISGRSCHVDDDAISGRWVYRGSMRG